MTSRQPFRPVRSLRWLLAALLAVAAVTGRAAPIEAPDPVAFARLPIAQQEAVRDDIHRQMLAATPQERSQFRHAMRLSIVRLTTEERREIAELARRRWQQLAPEQRERLTRQRRERAEHMSPEERKEALEQRRLLLEAPSPDERARLEQPLPSK